MTATDDAPGMTTPDDPNASGPLDPANPPSWAELHSHIDAVHAAWQAATAGLTGEERPPEAQAPDDTGDAEETWGATMVHSHVANALLVNADVLARVAVSREATFAPPQRVLPGHHPYQRIRQIGEKGWTDFRSSARTVAKQPDRGPVITVRGQQIDARGFVCRCINHVNDHIQQIERISSAG